MTVRKLRKQDQWELMQICADTAIVGKPIDPLFSDRELFAELMLGYYLNDEPKHTLVVEEEGDVVGYLTGSTNPRAQWGIIKSGAPVVWDMADKLVSGEYAESPQNRQFLKWLFTRMPLEMPKHPKNSAHAHFNLMERVRGRGLGPLLISSALDLFREDLQGLDYLYGEVIAHPGKSLSEFERMGFEIYDKKRTTLYEGHLQGPVHLACIVKPLK